MKNTWPVENKCSYHLGTFKLTARKGSHVHAHGLPLPEPEPVVLANQHDFSMIVHGVFSI